MFQEPKHYIETHGLDTPPYEHFTVCPHCGGAFVEAHRCDCYGLLEHSLNVYKALKKLVKQHEEVEVSDETLAISALFHDICKANLYVVGSRNVKDEQTGQWHKEAIYKHDDQFPVGHGEKSVIILLRHMALTDDEIYAIRFHMGGFDSAVKGGDGSISKAYELCPLAVLLHLADMTASYLMEDHNA